MLTKSDLLSIDKIFTKSIFPLNKKIDKIDNKLEKLFNFLDRKYLDVKKDIRNIQEHLNLPISEF